MIGFSSAYAPSHPEYVGFEAPLKQVAQGIKPPEVTCNEGLVLIFKYNGSPACVKAETAIILQERGWGGIAPPSMINSFEECVAAGNPVMESYPRQCRTQDGKHFVESLSEQEQVWSGAEGMCAEGYPDCEDYVGSIVEPGFKNDEPFTKIEIMFGEKWNDKLVPVTFTEVTTHAETLDEITVWNFGLIGYSGGDRGIVWDTLPDEINRIWYEITDDNGKKIIDNTRMPESWVIPADQHIYEMNCGLFQTVEGESAHPTSILIKNNTSIIHARNSWMGIYPDSNGEYSFEFASIFEHYVRLHEDIGVIISHETKECDAMWQIDGKPQMESGNGYYTKMSFRFE